MALTELELKRCEKAIAAFMEKRRPPEHVREQIDLGYRIVGQSIEIFEIFPSWRDKSQKIEEPVAKAKYVRTQNEWKIYWMRQDLKWHEYEPAPSVKHIDEFLSIIDEDKYNCFFS